MRRPDLLQPAHEGVHHGRVGADGGEEEHDRVVAAPPDHRVEETVEERPVVERLRGAVDRVAGGREREQGLELGLDRHRHRSHVEPRPHRGVRHHHSHPARDGHQTRPPSVRERVRRAGARDVDEFLDGAGAMDPAPLEHLRVPRVVARVGGGMGAGGRRPDGALPGLEHHDRLPGLRRHREGRLQLVEIAASFDVRDDDLGILVARRAGDPVRHVHVALVAGRAPEAEVEPSVAEQQGGVRPERSGLADERDVAGRELDLVERAHERAEEAEPGVHDAHAVGAEDAHVGVASDRLDVFLKRLPLGAALREAGAHHHARAAAAVVGGAHHVRRVPRRHHDEHEVGGGGEVVQGRDWLVSLHRAGAGAHRVHRPREPAVA